MTHPPGSAGESLAIAFARMRFENWLVFPEDTMNKRRKAASAGPSTLGKLTKRRQCRTGPAAAILMLACGAELTRK